VAEDILELTMKEADRLKVIWQVISKQLKVRQAAEQLELSRRQVLRVMKRIREEGNRGVVHRLRKRASNHHLPGGLLEQAVATVMENYWDFGPTFANEYLQKEHNIWISTNTLRKGMIQSGLWLPHRRKVKHRRYRDRKECVGELIQLDGSIHPWFEERGPSCVLLIFIDDATSWILHGEFVTAEDTINLMRATKSYLQKYGRPVAFYVDKDSIYRINRQPTIEEQLRDKQPITQFSRAMEELAIRVNFAHSPQAKGRVERGFKTHQDRLVKELRLNKICTINQANHYLNEIYLPAHNSRRPVRPASWTDAHKPLLKEHRLDEILSIRTERTLAKDFTVQFEKSFFQLQPEKKSLLKPGHKILVEIRLDGSLYMRSGKQYVCYKLIEKPLPLAPTRVHIPQGRRIHPVKPDKNHPWRNFKFGEKFYDFK
jgi:hypothetical protein